MKCLHGPAAVCWLCSDQVSWWREARIKAGMGEDPPHRTDVLLRRWFASEEGPYSPERWKQLARLSRD